MRRTTAWRLSALWTGPIWAPPMRNTRLTTPPICKSDRASLAAKRRSTQRGATRRTADCLTRREADAHSNAAQGGAGMAAYDCLVIGAGHNGLTFAAYLARTGLRVGVIERNGKLGGGTSTEEPTLPGYRFNLHSNFLMGFRHAPLMHDLELYRFGYSYIEPPVQQAAAFRDGTCVVIHKDLDATCRSLARFSRRDAETFRDLHELYGRTMRPLLRSLLYNAPLPIAELRDRLSGPQGREFLSHAQHDLFSVVRKHFDDDRIRTLFTSYMHVITTENVMGAGIVFPLIFANVMEFTLPVGGSASFTGALARVIEACGGSVMTGADVKEVVVRNSRAAAVRLADGSAVEASRFIASAIDAPSTMRMAGDDLFPEDVRKKL